MKIKIVKKKKIFFLNHPVSNFFIFLGEPAEGSLTKKRKKREFKLILLFFF